MLIVTGAVLAHPGQESATRAAGLAHVERSRREDGCIHHSMAEDCENPRRFVFLEQWRDMAALQAHFRQPGSAELMKSVRKLCESHEPIVIYEAVLAG